LWLLRSEKFAGLDFGFAVSSLDLKVLGFGAHVRLIGCVKISRQSDVLAFSGHVKRTHRLRAGGGWLLGCSGLQSIGQAVEQQGLRIPDRSNLASPSVSRFRTQAVIPRTDQCIQIVKERNAFVGDTLYTHRIEEASCGNF
jgi:hypothetical protein